MCGSVNHLVKDCPDQIPKEAEGKSHNVSLSMSNCKRFVVCAEPDVTIPAMDQFTNPDAQEIATMTQTKAAKRAKIVKF